MVGLAIGASVAAGVAGGALQASAAGDAAKAQAGANQKALNVQQAQYNITRGDLLPYNYTGQNNLDAFGGFYKTTADQLGTAYSDAQNHIPQAMTEANLVNTPGYQFNLSQGLKAAQNSAAAHGLGVSGAAMNSASNYATGLADSTYQNQFSNQQTIYNDYLNQAQLKGNQLNQIFGQISAPVSIGENAAATTGNIGQQSANAQSQLLNNTGAAQAAGITGTAAGYSNALNSVGNAGINYLGLSKYLNSGAGGSSAPAAGPYIDTTSTF